MTANDFKTYIVIRELNGYRKRQAKENEKSQCFKGWETLDIFFIIG